MPIIQQVRVDKTNPRSRYLLEKAGNATSQHGEDGIIAHIFNTISARGLWCVEFGAWDGKHLSNTYNLIHTNHWNGVLIEGNVERFQELNKTYKDCPNAHMLCGMVDFVAGPNSLDSMLAKTAIPENFDLLSIDIDGNDWHVWHSLEKYRPRIIVIEFNPSVPNDVLFIQDRDPAINQGCSLSALIELGKAKGYELICATPINGIFVVKEEYAKFGIEDNSIDAMYAPMTDGRVFHGYDGKIYTVGMHHLIWHSVPVPVDALQILPDEKRRYGDQLLATGT